MWKPERIPRFFAFWGGGGNLSRVRPGPKDQIERGQPASLAHHADLPWAMFCRSFCGCFHGLPTDHHRLNDLDIQKSDHKGRFLKFALVGDTSHRRSDPLGDHRRLRFNDSLPQLFPLGGRIEGEVAESQLSHRQVWRVSGETKVNLTTTTDGNTVFLGSEGCLLFVPYTFILHAMPRFRIIKTMCNPKSQQGYKLWNSQLLIILRISVDPSFPF